MVHWHGMPADWNSNWPASYGLRLDVIEAVEAFHDANEEHIVQVSEWGADLPGFLVPNERVLAIAAGYEQGRGMPQACILTLTVQRLWVKNSGRESLMLTELEDVAAGPSSLLIQDSPLELRYRQMTRHFRLRGQETARRFADCITKAIEGWGTAPRPGSEPPRGR